jgi:Flp pilus assembly protein TadG
MTAIAVDVGSYSADRRDLQNSADAIALAASRELPDAAAARSKADEWAVKNDIDPADMTVTIIPQSLPSEPNPKVRVRIERGHDFTFAKMIGVSSADVQASAAAVKTSAAGGAGMIPLSLTEQQLLGAAPGTQLVLKYDANNIVTGNTSPVRIDGPGSGNCSTSDGYCDGLKYGSENTVCALGTDDTYCDGPSVVDTEPGNKIGATREAIQYRMDTTDTQCDTFGEVFQDDPTTSEVGVYHLTQACNPFLTSTTYASNRVLIVPVINQLCNGSCSVTIVDFALFFLEGFGSGSPNGNGNGQACTGTYCEVIGTLVRVNQNVGLLAGTFDPQSSNHFVRLVE